MSHLVLTTAQVEVLSGGAVSALALVFHTCVPDTLVSDSKQDLKSI
ncbi:MAG: hypothetical protein H0W34_11415 [Pyrinomonadaceae bacterium]|nr:hypothetical protein [Pyrinomonadaceae bacterium]